MKISSKTKIRKYIVVKMNKSMNKKQCNSKQSFFCIVCHSKKYKRKWKKQTEKVVNNHENFTILYFSSVSSDA